MWPWPDNTEYNSELERKVKLCQREERKAVLGRTLRRQAPPPPPSPPPKITPTTTAGQRVKVMIMRQRTICLFLYFIVPQREWMNTLYFTRVAETTRGLFTSSPRPWGKLLLTKGTMSYSMSSTCTFIQTRERERDRQRQRERQRQRQTDRQLFFNAHTHRIPRG